MAIFAVATAVPICIQAQDNSVPLADVLKDVIHRSSLVEPGSPPFYLKAKITNTRDPIWPYTAEVEEYWVSPEKWRRTISSNEFSQTLIVNGSQNSEQDSGDYFPPVLDQTIASLVDPLPAAEMALLAKLNMEIKKPDGKPGQCTSDTQFRDDYGDQKRAVVSLYCESGLLQYTYLPGWNVGVFDDYRAFHDKRIARRTKDNAVVAEIEVLRDLGKTDDSLFAAGAATSTHDRLRTVLVPGAEYRKLAVTAPEIQWPQVSSPPENGTVLVNIVADRAGRIREAKSNISANNELRDFAAQQIKSWTFKPYLVDGSAVQVETTLALDFHADLKADLSRMPLAHTYFDRARGLSGFRVQGAQPFHMKGSFEAMGKAELTGSGTYEEIWISPIEWRREVTLAGQAVVESRDGEAVYRKFTGAYAPRRCDELLDAMSAGFPGDNGGDFDDSDWHVAQAPLGGTPLIRVSRGYIDDRDKPDTGTMMYYFDPVTGLLRAYFNMAEIAVFNGFQQFNSVQVPRRVSAAEYGEQILQLNVDVLESIQPPPASTFILEDAQKWPADLEDSSTVSITPPRAVKQVKPQYPEDARRRNIHQKVLCTVMVDKRGHVRGVAFQGNADQALQDAVRQAMFQCEFTPAMLKGGPAPFPIHYTFEF